MTSICVAMATFNGERFLGEQLESLARQTLQPAELVVCDDGSEDGTVNVLERFSRASQFPVRVVRNEKWLGFADTFLRAASLCSGQLIAFCDQDDVWLEDKLARCASAARGDVVLVMHTSRVVDDALRPTDGLYPRFDASSIEPPLTTDPWLAVRGMSMVFAAALVHRIDWKIRPPSHYLEGTPVNHDEWVYLLARGLGSIALIAEPLALYRRHASAVTGPTPSGRARSRELLTTGWTYYSARREQARALERVFERLSGGDLADAARVVEAARSYHSLAARIEQRLRVYDPAASRARRALRLAHLVHAGTYRRGAGFGPLAGVRDGLMIALGRGG